MRAATRRRIRQRSLFLSLARSLGVAGARARAPRALLEVEFALNGESSAQLDSFLGAVQGVTLGVFTLECAVKIVAKGARPLTYFSDAAEGAFNT